MKAYRTVYEGGRGEIVEKKSRFIAHVATASTVEEAQLFIDRIRKEYWDARHNCSAFSVGTTHPLTRSSDDGEPSGTAGKPILEVITGSGIRNIVIVVTRYFGGTLLGTGGLVRAYTEAAREGIRNCVIIDKVPGVEISIDTDYTDLGKIQYILAQHNTPILNTEYTDKVLISAIFPLEDEKELGRLLSEGTSGRVRLEKGEDVFFGLAKGEIVLFKD